MLYSCCANLSTELLQFGLLHVYTCCLCGTSQFQCTVDTVNTVDGAAVT